MNVWVFSAWSSLIFKYNAHVVHVLYVKHCYTLFVFVFLFQPNKRYTSAVHAAILDKYSSSAPFPSISAKDCEISILLQSITVRHGTLYCTDLYAHVAPTAWTGCISHFTAAGMLSLWLPTYCWLKTKCLHGDFRKIVHLPLLLYTFDVAYL